MKKYFLHDGSQQSGPFELEELKSKKLNRDTPIWFEGLDEWTTINKVEELKELITSTPPPFISKMASPPPIPDSQTSTKISVERPNQRTLNGRKILVYISIIVLVLIGFFVFDQIKQQRYQNYRQNTINAEEDNIANIRNNITSFVTAESSDYQYSSLGGIYNLKITITNNTDYLIDNVKVKVTYIKANGEIWDSKIIDFNLLNPRTKSTVKVPDTERGTSVQHEILSIKSTALGLN